MDGFDLHTGGRCVTVFSATNYCGCTQNSGAVLEVFWDLTPGSHLTTPPPPPTHVHPAPRSSRV